MSLAHTTLKKDFNKLNIMSGFKNIKATTYTSQSAVIRVHKYMIAHWNGYDSIIAQSRGDAFITKASRRE